MVVATEVNRYVYDRVRRWAAERGVEQTPKFISDIQGDFALAFLPRMTGRRKQMTGERLSEIVLRIDPPGAKVEIDGQTVPMHGAGTAAVARIAPGRHHVRVSKQGYQPAERIIEIGSSDVKARARLGRSVAQSEVTLTSGRTMKVTIVERTPTKLVCRTSRGGTMKIPTAMVAKCVELPDTANVLGEPSSIAVETAGPESIQQRERKLPKTFKNSLDIELVLVPAGEFVMGSDEHRGDSAPEHKVRISRAFYNGQARDDSGRVPPVLAGIRLSHAGRTDWAGNREIRGSGLPQPDVARGRRLVGSRVASRGRPSRHARLVVRRRGPL